MNDQLRELVRASLDLPSCVTYLTSSGIVNLGSCLLDEIIVTANGGDVTVKVYDGSSDKGDQLATLLVKDGYSQTFTFGRGGIIDKGIYLDVTSSYSFVTVNYRVMDQALIL